MRTRWAARGGVRRVVASGLCEERGGRNRLDRAGTHVRITVTMFLWLACAGSTGATPV